MSRSLWTPWAVRRPGPAVKQRGTRTESRAIVIHSMVGSVPGALSVLDNISNPRYSPIAWHASVAKDGTLYQHYAWSIALNHAAGGRDWSIGVEIEGGPEGNEAEPWTPEQFATAVRLLRWLLAEGWLPHLVREGPEKSAYRHYEVPGSSTECDSGRTPWPELIPAVYQQEEDSMASQEYEELDQRVRKLRRDMVAANEAQNGYIVALNGNLENLRTVVIAVGRDVASLKEGGGDGALARRLDELEREHEEISTELAAHEGRMRAAARALGGEE